MNPLLNKYFSRWGWAIVRRLGSQKLKDKWIWYSFRPSYRESLERKARGIKSCKDCIFRWWPDSEECENCDGTPKNWGTDEKDEKAVALAKRVLGIK